MALSQDSIPSLQNRTGKNYECDKPFVTLKELGPYPGVCKRFMLSALVVWIAAEGSWRRRRWSNGRHSWCWLTNLRHTEVHSAECILTASCLYIYETFEQVSK